MVQFYFLSVLANILGGIALSAGLLDEKMSGFAGIKAFFDEKPGFRVTVGVIAVVTGILKLLSATRGDVPVVGDLLPSLTGLAVGAAVLYERYKEKSTVETEVPSAAEKLLINNKSILGVASIVVGLVHFFIPSVLFL